jgi:replicative DNA helicase
MSEPASFEKITSLKVPPHSVEAEQAVLGALMLDNSRWDAVHEILLASDFYRREHRLIFDAMVQQAAASKPIDVITLSEALHDSNQLAEAGGLDYLGELVNSTQSAANIVAYAGIVKERAILRKLISVAHGIADSGYNPDGRASAELLDAAEQAVYRIADERPRDGGPVAVNPILKSAVDRIERLFDAKGSITGLSTGFKDIDDMTSGLQQSDLVIVAGRPSMGKTSYAMNMVEHAILHQEKPVLVFSLEMPADSLIIRMLSSLGKIDQTRMRNGKLENDDWDKLGMAVAKLRNRPLFIDDTSGLSPSEMRARARRVARENGDLGMIMVDYLQLMQVKGSSENRTGEISEISRSLKLMAREFNCPVVALSQLNRSLEQRPNKRPVMSDLRECVTGDTLVTLSSGARVPIAELVGKTPEVLALDENFRIVKAQAELVWSTGIKPVFRIHLASGRTLDATANHRVLTGSGWHTVTELLPGSRMAVARRIPDAELSKHATSDIFWDRVVLVEAIGEQEVFDLTVPGPACWLADGIVSHNSGAIEQDADVIMFVYRHEVYEPDNDQFKGMAEIIIGKQRNGPIGTRTLSFIGKFTRFENYAPMSGGPPPNWHGE